MTEKQMNGRSSQQSVSRRTAVKLLGTAGVTSLVGIPGVISADNDDENILEESYDLREENDWSATEWREFLANEGIQMKTADQEFSIPTLGAEDEDDGSVGIQELDSDKCTLEITFGWDPYPGQQSDVFDVAWEIETDGNIIADTSGPNDLISIGWSDNHYLKDGDKIHGPHCSDPQGRDSTAVTGVVVQYDVAADGEITKARNPRASSWTLDSYFSVPVDTVDESQADERRIELDYHHRYGVANFNGISWGGGVPSLAFGIGEERWVREAEPEESEMEDTYVDHP